MSISSRSAISCALRSGRTLNPMMMALEAEAGSTSDSLIAPTPDRMMRILTLSSELGQCVGEHFSEALHVGLLSGSSLTPPSAICSFNDSSVRRPPWRRGRAPCLRLAERRDLSRLCRISDGLKRVAWLRQTGQTEYFDRSGWPGGFHRSAAIVDEGPDLADHGTGDEVVADIEGAVPVQDGGDRPRPPQSSWLAYCARCAAFRLARQLEDVGGQQNHLEQLIEVLPLLRGRHHDRLSAPVFRRQVELGQLAFDVVRVCARLSILLIATTMGTFAALA